MRKNVFSTSRLGPRGEASSRQWLRIRDVALPAGDALADLLLELDLAYRRAIETITGDLVFVREEAEGALAVVVQPLGPVGLRLGPPRIGGGRIAREIVSGWLVGERGGEIALSLAPEGEDVIAAIEVRGFRSRFASLGAVGRYVYRGAQVVIHRRLSRIFLNRDVAPRLLARASGGRRRAARSLEHAGAST